MNVKNLNEGDFQPVVGLDVQHVDLVAGDWEAPIVLDEMSVVKIMMTKKDLRDGPGDVDFIRDAVLISSFARLGERISSLMIRTQI